MHFICKTFICIFFVFSFFFIPLQLLIYLFWREIRFYLTYYHSFSSINPVCFIHCQAVLGDKINLRGIFRLFAMRVCEYRISLYPHLPARCRSLYLKSQERRDSINPFRWILSCKAGAGIFLLLQVIQNMKRRTGFDS